MSAWSEPGGGGGGYSLQLQPITPAVKRLMLILVGIWVLSFALNIAAPALSRGVVENFGVNPGAWFKAPFFLPFWQPFTYGWLHSTGSVWHLLQNLLVLYFFGTLLEGIVGSRRFLTLYMVGLVGAGLFSLVVKAALDIPIPTVGASGAILAVTVAAAVFKPDTPVLLLFIPVQLKWLAIGLVAIDVIGAAGQLANGYLTPTDNFAHLAGGAIGFFAARKGWVWVDATAVVQQRLDVSRAKKQATNEARLDELLERINTGGLGSLTEAEKAFLKRMSKRS